MEGSLLPKRIIDAHIHFDQYKEKEREKIICDLQAQHIKALISVSWNVASAKKNLQLAKDIPEVFPAIGFHPEQELPSREEVDQIRHLIKTHEADIVAIGEIGLPYYFQRKNPHLQIGSYVKLLELFIQDAKRLTKPVTLHAIYEDAKVVCDLLESYRIEKAHFHWFKGDHLTIERMIRNGYFISVTPDIIYEREIQQLVRHYPLSLMMVETDGPWPFKGPFEDKMTHPKMIHQVVSKIAEIKDLQPFYVYKKLYENTIFFYFDHLT